MTMTSPDVDTAPARRPPATPLLWLVSTAAFPVAGLAGLAAAGPVTTAGSALLGGVVTGAVIGLAQALTSARRLPLLRWTVGTALGLAAGLTAGAGAVGFGTGLADLVVQGLLTGTAVGLAQAYALPAPTRSRVLWAATAPALWALGWTVTTLAGVDVERHYTVFGLTGALAYTVLSGIVLAATRVRPRARGSVTR